MYKLRLSRRDKKKLLRLKWLIIFLVACAVGFIVWLAWIRPMQQGASANTFDECVREGNPIQQTYPEVCLTKDGQRFVNPKQDQARAASLDDSDELVPPSNPELLNLDIEEWGVRIPLTVETFDLSYAYVENGESEYLLFSYKRFIRLGVCQGDVGLKVVRRFAKNQPPYSTNNPAPVANVDKAYFYPYYADKPCYDTTKADQAALLKQIAGDKTLVDATTSLVTKMIASPKE